MKSAAIELGQVIKTFTSNKGNTVVFRYPTAGDVDAMLTYVNELIREDTFIEMSGKELTREEEEKYLENALEEIRKDMKRMLIVEVNGQYAGSGEVRRQTFRKRHVGDIGISLAKAVREEGIGHELMKALIDEARSLELKLLTLSCFENNQRALHVYKKTGFRVAGIMPGAVLFKEKYIGEIKMYLHI